MSAYAFVKYEAGKNGVAGSRVVPVTFKTDKVTKIKRDSMSVTVPVVSKEFITGNITTLVEAIKVWAEDTQDKMIREYLVAGKVSIEDTDIDATAIAAYMRESLSSGRLSGELLETWFADNMEAQLLLALSEKLGITEESPIEQQKQLESMVEVYKKSIVSLASGRTAYDKDKAGKILRAFEVCGMLEDTYEDDIGGKLITKLRVMMQAPEAVDLFAL